MNTTVILPARNEADSIGIMIKMLLAVYPESIKKVIVVDDGSRDKTAAIVAAIAKKDKRVSLIRRSPPHGVGLTIREGLKNVPLNSDYILSLDADFIRNIPDLELFFTKINEYDGLIGSRYMRSHSLIRYPYVKKICNRVFHLLVRLMYGVKQHDLTNNFKLYKKSVFDTLQLTATDFAINAETGLYPILLGYKIKELPVTWYAREDGMGVSKFNLFQVASSYFTVLIKSGKYSQTTCARILKRIFPGYFKSG
jgi:dolichol-phosphate mannosyltransferase